MGAQLLAQLDNNQSLLVKTKYLEMKVGDDPYLTPPTTTTAAAAAAATTMHIQLL